LKGEGVESVIWIDGQIVTSNIIEMLVHDADGRNPTKLQSYSSIYRQLARCGPHQVAYWAVDRQHHSHIARTDIVTGSTTGLTDGPRDFQPTCSVDGSTLVFMHFQDNRCSLTRKSLDSGQSLTLYETSPCKIGGSTLSLDGTKVLFWKEPDAKDPLAWAAVVPVAGGNPQNLKMPVPDADVGGFTWAPDGKSILYALATNGVGNVWSVPLDGKPPRELTAFDSDQIFSFDVSPDNRLVISRGSVVRDVVLIKNAMN
jgi:Tol biopolymer transport system component